nr:patatin-like phospholipase family protein [Dechloromonas sp.]
MSKQDFITAAANHLAEIEEARKGKQIVVSDFVSKDADGNTYQYVDVVMEGGGVLGLALVGYLYALERAGIRFLSIGGTSAGSIVALLTAAAGKPHEARIEKLIEVMAKMPVASFQDGDDDAREFIDWLKDETDKLFQPGISFSEIGAWVSGISKILQVRDNFKKDLGLCKGEAFKNWVSKQLTQFGISSTRSLMEKIQPGPGEISYVGNEPDPAARLARLKASLCLVASDLTTERKVCFPNDTALYFDDPYNVSPAEYVRASMSVPFFFHPKRCSVPSSQETSVRWGQVVTDGESRAQKYGANWPPKECVLVDGGIMSNFPIDAFHAKTRVPSCPTFGVKLEVDRPYTEIDSPVDLLFQLFNGARHCRDNDFIEQNPDFNKLVQSIDTGNHNWLNFNISQKDQIDLFKRGVEAAKQFLLGDGSGRSAFDWANYKEIRRGIAEAENASATGVANA